MLDLFSDDADLRGTYLRFLISQARLADAETYMRLLADAAESPKERQGVLVALIRLKVQNESREEAISELEALIASE